MLNQKGQIHIIILALIVIGFILYANIQGKSLFSGLSGKSFLPSSPGSSTKISAPASKNSSPAPVPSPTPFVPDTTSPQRFNPQPKNSKLSADTRKVTFGLETNEKATCKYGTIAGLGYDSMQGRFDQTNATLHTTLLTTLSEGEKYKYYVRCIDEQGNKNIDDYAISFEVKLPEDKMPPILSNPSHQGDVLLKGTREAVISVSTNEPASCRYSTNGGTPYGGMSGRFSYYDQTQRFHVKTLTKLEDGKTYDFFVRCRDSAGNTNTGDVLIRFSIGQ